MQNANLARLAAMMVAVASASALAAPPPPPAVQSMGVTLTAAEPKEAAPPPPPAVQPVEPAVELAVRSKRNWKTRKTVPITA